MMRSSGLLGVSIQTQCRRVARAPRRAPPLAEVHETHLERAARVQRVEQAVRAAVAVVRRDDELLGPNRAAHERDRGHARGRDHDRAGAAFEVGERAAERVARRIAGARVVVVALLRRNRANANVEVRWIGGTTAPCCVVGLERGAHRPGRVGVCRRSCVSPSSACANAARRTAVSFRNASWPYSELSSRSWQPPPSRVAQRAHVGERHELVLGDRDAASSARGCRAGSTRCRSIDSDRQRKDFGPIAARRSLAAREQVGLDRKDACRRRRARPRRRSAPRTRAPSGRSSWRARARARGRARHRHASGVAHDRALDAAPGGRHRVRAVRGADRDACAARAADAARRARARPCRRTKRRHGVQAARCRAGRARHGAPSAWS